LAWIENGLEHLTQSIIASDKKHSSLRLKDQQLSSESQNNIRKHYFIGQIKSICYPSSAYSIAGEKEFNSNNIVIAKKDLIHTKKEKSDH
jgi:hypothetical protein